MNFLVFIIIVAATSFYYSGKLKSENTLFLNFFVTWVTTLIALNLLISLFIYLFSHSVKKADGNEGVRGMRGRRGPEGKSETCKFRCQ